MKRWKKPKDKRCSCVNCGYVIKISPYSVKEQTFDDVIATYVECPVCGEKMLKQLDTAESQELAQKCVKLNIRQREGKKLTDKQKAKLRSAIRVLNNTRKQLNRAHWDEVYQSLNQYEEPKTETADQELTLGEQVTSTVQAGERMNEHESV